MAVGDVILGVGGKAFSVDPRTEMGQALTAAESEAVRRSVRRGRPFRSPNWRKPTAVGLELEYTLRPQGRPKKGGS